MLRVFLCFSLLAVPCSSRLCGQRQQSEKSAIPATGTQLPNVKAFDEFGNQFSTSSLRGSYSVLVFGCLT